MGGGAAAGKTTVLKSGDMQGVPNRTQAIYQEADDYKSPNPEYRAMLGAGMSEDAAAIVHEESSALGKQIGNQAQANGQNLVVDALFNTDLKSNADKVDTYKAKGAGTVNAHYVVTDLPDAANRLVQREVNTGRAVPYPIAMGSHQSIARMLPDLVQNSPFDSTTIHDTSSKYAPGQDENGHDIPYAKPVLSMTKGGTTQMHDQAAYDHAIARATEVPPPLPPKPVARPQAAVNRPTTTNPRNA
jgi:hypothetical protein